MKARVLVAILSVIAIIGVSAAPASGGLTWKTTPVWEVDGSQVDLQFGYTNRCLDGPISVLIEYPAGADIALINEDEAPPEGYVWTTQENASLELSASHIEIVATAIFPGDCNSKAAVRFVPLSDRFHADENTGRYGTEVVVRS
jgi:hypothetical protein